MPGGLAEYLMGIVNAKNVPEIMASFKKIILSAYGIKSADGRRLEKGEEISTHQSGGDAMVTVLEGTGRFTIDGEPHLVKEGETIVMPAKHPHAVYGEERFKMLLTVVF